MPKASYRFKERVHEKARRTQFPMGKSTEVLIIWRKLHSYILLTAKPLAHLTLGQMSVIVIFPQKTGDLMFVGFDSRLRFIRA
jgi:hypothetical protein